MNYTHDQEQMEAYRRDFQKHFGEVIIPILKGFKVEPKNLPAIEHACWNCFLKGRKHRP